MKRIESGYKLIEVPLSGGRGSAETVINVATIKIISLESQQKNADISIFLKKERKDISLHISVKFAFKH